MNQVCEGFSNCLELTTETCDSCFSGSRNCEGILIYNLIKRGTNSTSSTILDLTCWKEGLCLGSLIEDVSADEELGCRNACRQNTLCEWFTFDDKHHECKLFLNCPNVSDDFCTSCISGQQQCGGKPGKL